MGGRAKDLAHLCDPAAKHLRVDDEGLVRPPTGSKRSGPGRKSEAGPQSIAYQCPGYFQRAKPWLHVYTAVDELGAGGHLPLAAGHLHRHHLHARNHPVLERGGTRARRGDHNQPVNADRRRHPALTQLGTSGRLAETFRLPATSSERGDTSQLME